MGKPVSANWINLKLWRQAVQFAVSGLALPMVALLLCMAPAHAQEAVADSTTVAIAQPGGPGTPQDFTQSFLGLKHPKSYKKHVLQLEFF